MAATVARALAAPRFLLLRLVLVAGLMLLVLGVSSASAQTVSIGQWPEGSWVDNFGSQGYALGGWNGGGDYAQMPGVSETVTHGSRYIWATSTTDQRAPQSPDGTYRKAATLYDPNEIRVVLKFNNAYTGNLRLYGVDWDSQGRRETISVGGQTVNVGSDFTYGAWARFPISVSAGGSVTITVDHTAGLNAVLSGIFLGGGGAPPSTVPISQAPQGSWVGQSGSRGYALAGYTWGSDLASLPGASLSLSQGSRYVWSASSTDSRVLQSPDQVNRRAATYYDPNEIRSVLTFTAAYSGNLHLYALDWGSWGRRETITVGGRTAYLSGDFNQGAWLTFPISVPAGGSVTIKVDNTGPINAVLGGIFLGDAGAPPSHPQSASSFVDSVGVNVHASYFDTAYANSSVWENELVKLGVHNVRDMACVGCTQQNQVLMNLAGVGIKTDFIMRWPGSPDSIGSLVSMLDGPMFPAVASIEGPNEYDTSGNANWVSDLRSYQQSLYQQAKATTKLSTVPVLGPSLVSSQDASALGNLGSWLDQGNMHPYPGGQLPLANVPFNEQAETSVEQGKPLTASETGYNNALASTGGNLPVSETAAAAYVPRTFLDHFRDGITRTYLYELADEKPDSGLTNQEQHFGLLRNDLSEKPAFGTLQALLSSVAPTTSTAFAPSGLNYQLAQGPSDLRQLLLQTGPSSYALVLWRDVSVWNTSTGQDLTVVPQPVNLSFGQTVTSLTSRQLDAGGFTPLSVPAIGQPAALSVGAMPVVVRITTG